MTEHCEKCEWLAKFKKLPGFVSLTNCADGSIICRIALRGISRRFGAENYSDLYDYIKDELENIKKIKGS
jgi:hypothetical protein